MNTPQTQQPDALRLADALHAESESSIKAVKYSTAKKSAAELRRQHAEIERLTAENEALKEKVAGCDIMGLAEEQRQLRGPFHGIGTPNRAMFD